MQVSFQQTFEQKRSAHVAELQQKEDEMRQMFVQRVKEKEVELKEAEKEVSGVLCMDNRVLNGYLANKQGPLPSYYVVKNNFFYVKS